MKSVLKLLTILFLSTASAQQKIPDWFVENMKASTGTWITDNTSYQNQNEPFDQYGMHWDWGVGKQSITGKLYGLINGKKQGVLWEFRQYWDYGKNRGVIIQYGADGTVGKGPLTLKNDQISELIQEFVAPNGKKTIHGHRSTLKDGELITTSFDIDSQGAWQKRRTYNWNHIENQNSMN